MADPAIQHRPQDLARTERRGADRIATLTGNQGEPRRRGELDDGVISVSRAQPAGSNRPADGIGGRDLLPFPAAAGLDRGQGPLAAVGERRDDHFVARSPTSPAVGQRACNLNRAE